MRHDIQSNYQAVLSTHYSWSFDWEEVLNLDEDGRDQLSDDAPPFEQGLHIPVQHRESRNGWRPGSEDRSRRRLRVIIGPAWEHHVLHRAHISEGSACFIFFLGCSDVSRIGDFHMRLPSFVQEVTGRLKRSKIRSLWHSTRGSLSRVSAPKIC